MESKVTKEELKEVYVNFLKLRLCEKHYVVKIENDSLHKYRCLLCEGALTRRDLINYIEGYVANGGKPQDIYSNYEGIVSFECPDCLGSPHKSFVCNTCFGVRYLSKNQVKEYFKKVNKTVES